MIIYPQITIFAAGLRHEQDIFPPAGDLSTDIGFPTEKAHVTIR